MNQPSSTITAATLTGMAITFVFEIMLQFGFEPRATLVGSAVALGGGIVGYYRKERVLAARFKANPKSLD